MRHVAGGISDFSNDGIINDFTILVKCYVIPYGSSLTPLILRPINLVAQARQTRGRTMAEPAADTVINLHLDSFIFNRASPRHRHQPHD
jgi:hypothetical protein